MRDQRNDLSDAALAYVEENEALAPSNFFPEFVNAFLRAERRGRIAPSITSAAIADLRDLEINSETVDPDVVASYARAHSLTAYDASYLALAADLDVPLVTLDESLARAAASMNLRWTPPKKKADK